MRPPEAGERVKRLLAILFWLAAWEAAARAVGHEFLLASPAAVARSLFELLQRADTYMAAFHTASRILLGFSAGAMLGAVVAWLGARYGIIRRLTAPAVGAARSVPVASFAILAIILAGSRGLSFLVTLVVAFPVVSEAAREGLAQKSKALEEMAQVFRVPRLRRFLYVTLPRALPHLKVGLLSALGMCFKSGVAAELIGIPAGTIGEKLYVVKVGLRTPELFAWTLLIVAVGSLCAAALRGMLASLNRGLARL